MMRTMRTDLRRLCTATGFGVFSGTVYGGLQVLGGESMLTGVVTGLVFATFMAAGFYAGLTRVPHLSDLNYRQQRTVVRAVRLGRGVDDPALAEPTIRHARWIQRSARPQRWMTVLVGSLLGASGLVLVVALVLGDAYFAFAGAFSLVVWTLILLVGPRVDRRRVAQAQRAETAAMERSVDRRS
jgi:hypothetical protein